MNSIFDYEMEQFQSAFKTSNSLRLHIVFVIKYR